MQVFEVWGSDGASSVEALAGERLIKPSQIGFVKTRGYTLIRVDELTKNKE